MSELNKELIEQDNRLTTRPLIKARIVYLLKRKRELCRMHRPENTEKLNEYCTKRIQFIGERINNLNSLLISIDWCVTT